MGVVLFVIRMKIAKMISIMASIISVVSRLAIVELLKVAVAAQIVLQMIRVTDAWIQENIVVVSQDLTVMRVSTALWVLVLKFAKYVLKIPIAVNTLLELFVVRIHKEHVRYQVTVLLD
jgi:hypothetical protein